MLYDRSSYSVHLEKHLRSQSNLETSEHSLCIGVFERELSRFRRQLVPYCNHHLRVFETGLLLLGDRREVIIGEMHGT